jgi:hypothetical protein
MVLKVTEKRCPISGRDVSLLSQYEVDKLIGMIITFDKSNELSSKDERFGAGKAHSPFDCIFEFDLRVGVSHR